MSRNSGIEWTDSTWNPIRGCTHISRGCENCYAESAAARFSGPGQPYEGLAKFVVDDGVPEARWTNEVRLITAHLDDPLKWKKPAMILVDSMGDLFHSAVTFEWLVRIFDVMARARQHTYQILTKRPERMLDALLAGGDPAVAPQFEKTYSQPWPPKNWWFGVSVEDQKTADERIPILVKSPAHVKFVSYEPAIGSLDLVRACVDPVGLASIDWVICGGESGSRARPMKPQWARDVRDLCDRAGIPFFFKQWGEWAPFEPFDKEVPVVDIGVPPEKMWRVGKSEAGAVLDGISWMEFPR